MDNAKQMILHDEILSDSGSPFAGLCKVLSWVEAELLNHSQELVRKHTRLINQRQSITELIADEDPDLVSARAALTRALARINNSILQLETTLADAKIDICTQIENNPVASRSSSSGQPSPVHIDPSNAGRSQNEAEEQLTGADAPLEVPECYDLRKITINANWAIKIPGPQFTDPPLLQSDGRIQAIVFSCLGDTEEGDL
jgi:hypothetical protein